MGRGQQERMRTEMAEIEGQKDVYRQATPAQLVEQAIGQMVTGDRSGDVTVQKEARYGFASTLLLLAQVKLGMATQEPVVEAATPIEQA